MSGRWSRPTSSSVWRGQGAGSCIHGSQDTQAHTSSGLQMTFLQAKKETHTLQYVLYNCREYKVGGYILSLILVRSLRETEGRREGRRSSTSIGITRQNSQRTKGNIKMSHIHVYLLYNKSKRTKILLCFKHKKFLKKNSGNTSTLNGCNNVH